MRYAIVLIALTTAYLVAATAAQVQVAESEKDVDAGLEALLDADAGLEAHENLSPRLARQFGGFGGGPFGGGFGRRGGFGGGFGGRGFGGGRRRHHHRGGFGSGEFFG